MKFFKYCLIIAILVVLTACATYEAQYVNEEHIGIKFPDKEIAHSFYLIGDAGNSPIGTSSDAMKAFKSELQSASENSKVIFLGDNIYPKGMPKKRDEGRAFAEYQLDIQTEAVKDYKGDAVFIPGNHDWYSDGLKGLKRQEEYIEKALGKNTFLPENGCPIERVTISDKIVLIIVDSEWYMTNWDKHPAINDECEIKTRERFFDEFEGEIKKARGKTTLVAIHHPIFTNGSHGGQYSFKSHMSPLPILGTVKNIVRKTGGVITVDDQNMRYNQFRKRIITLAQENDKTIFVSGHDHNLQYLVEDNLPQIVSGAGSKSNPTRNVGGGKFSYGAQGYARLDVFKDGSSFVRFYSNNKVVFQTEIFPEDRKKVFTTYPKSFPNNKVASIYTEKEVNKTGVYKWLWGDRYRDDYGAGVMAPTVDLDTLFGGLRPVRKGGGHQSKSLRLKDKQGREYVMRALRKNAVQYLQAVAFKDQYIEGQFDNTITENLLLDVFAGSQPYAPFTIGKMSDAVGVYHTNPVLYYVPKQNALGHFATEFGDELYMIEERASSGHGDKASFGFSNKLISTDDLLKKLAKDEDFVVDEASYIRARLFDMLIGDWDRHEDQWRWAEFIEKGKKVYRPVPRDRDQAFAIMDDGALLSVVTAILPAAKGLKSYEEELKKPKWFNMSPYPLDMALINESSKSVWDTQVDRIVNNLTDQVINEAFLDFPPEINQNTVNEIKKKLKGRRSNLQKISDTYYYHINKCAVIKGTHKDDWFDVERLNDGQTKVTAYRIKKGVKADKIHERIYNISETKEIWIYGLDDDDRFEVFGNGNKLIKVRLIGGQNRDIYKVKTGEKLTIYDQKSKENEFVTNKGKQKLTDDYETNIYDYKKLKNSTNQFMPALGANPDDGFRIGFINRLTNYGFERNPFSSQHTIAASYYFATNGFDFGYRGEFANVFGSVNLRLDGRFTSPNYAINFFGYGNSTPNYEADDNDGIDVDLDYNRVKLQTLSFIPSLVWRGQIGGSFVLGLSYESIEVEETEGRFINDAFLGDNVGFKDDFYGISAWYKYENKDNKAFPTLGMLFSFKTGYKNNINESKGFAYVIPELGFDYKLVPNGQLVLATKLKGHVNFGDNFEFYQAANIGANNGLRGYRNERFTGKSAFAQSSDLRLNLSKVKTALVPLYIGFYGGFDYGRVWVDDNLVLDPSYNTGRWNTSVGGGVFINAVDLMTFNLSAFHSDDGLRLAFKLGFGF
ncbi:metallophosphoesterase [uncultured Algibacter sp.]|uniref:metallophosphoesterase n=1 Tax=uncultured Algibacter sp. TaxID=298659 RepID=UPI002632811F|nr:metallophosphoesterase [uncultured Algibacter sp.]